MKLNQPGLIGGLEPILDQQQTDAVRWVRTPVNMIQGKANKLVESEERLNAGCISPCWGFAMCYASQLLILHGDGVFGDHEWLPKVDSLKFPMERLSKRWKITGKSFLLFARVSSNRTRDGFANL